jgi:RES domain-containing protein
LADVLAADMSDDDLVAAADGDWSSEHEHEVLSASWRSFAHIVKYKTRYLFSSLLGSDTAGPMEIAPGDMLAALGRSLARFVRALPAGTVVFRARTRASEMNWTVCEEELTAPPPGKAGAGRMNPAGIPYLYTSFDAITAGNEVYAHERPLDALFVASFLLTENLWVVDLTSLPEPPPVFDVSRKGEREQLLFALDFVAEISKRVIRDGTEHVEYVPSQVVSEYLAQVFVLDEPIAELGGVIFPSSAYPGGRNLVVFPSRDRRTSFFHGATFRNAVEIVAPRSAPLLENRGQLSL